MAFTLKAYKKAQQTRTVAKNPAQKAQSTAAPTVAAGPKNSNGPKGGSSKSSVPANRTYLKTNNKGKPPKVAKVTASKLNTTSVTPFNRSTRVNYRQLKRSK